METILTASQQSIIDAITSEFKRVNSSTMVGRKFNLINVDKLNYISHEIKLNKEEAESDRIYWHEVAMNEAERIANLLQQDLPMACVERFGKTNGKYDAPSVIIQRESGRCGHHENYVSFDVIVQKKEVRQTHGCYYFKGVGLRYQFWETANVQKQYNSVEELFSKSTIAEQIRKKILR